MEAVPVIVSGMFTRRPDCPDTYTDPVWKGIAHRADVASSAGQWQTMRGVPGPPDKVGTHHPSGEGGQLGQFHHASRWLTITSAAPKTIATKTAK